MVMIHVDELPVPKRLVAHAAGMVLRFQKMSEAALGESIARNPVSPVGLLAGLR
jgi:hypothetical protein